MAVLLAFTSPRAGPPTVGDSLWEEWDCPQPGLSVGSRTAKLTATLRSFAVVRHELSRFQTLPNVLFSFNFVAA